MSYMYVKLSTKSLSFFYNNIFIDKQFLWE